MAPPWGALARPRPMLLSFSLPSGFRLGLLAGLLALAAAPPAPAAQRGAGPHAAAVDWTYRLTHLPTLGGPRATAADINDLGTVVGSADLPRPGGTGFPDQHACVWENGSVRDLGVLPGGTRSEAYAVNNRGHVFGGSASGDGWTYVLWREGGVVPVEGLDGAGFNSAGFNDRDQVIGARDVLPSPQRCRHAALWVEGTVTDLGALGPTRPFLDSYATAINNRGQVAGVSYTPDGQEQHAFLVTPQDTNGDGQPDTWYVDADQDGVNDLMQDLGTLGGGASRAYAIDDVGQVAGSSELSNGFVHAFLWHGGAMQDLGTLGGEASTAWFLDAQGHVAGWSQDASGRDRLTLWQGETVSDLSRLLPDTGSGLPSITVNALNNQGQFAAQDFAPLPFDTPWSPALLLSPVPAPDLRLALSAAPSAAAPGESVTLQARVSNAGPGDALQVALTLPVPVNSRFVSVTATAGTPVSRNGRVSLALSSLPPGQEVTLSLTVQALQPRDLVAGGRVTSDVRELSPDDNAVSLRVPVRPRSGPDLTGRWLGLTARARGSGAGLRVTLQGTFLALNSGTVAAPASFVRFFLSDDTELGTTDRLVGQTKLRTLAAGGKQGVGVSVTLGPAADPRGRYLLAVLDPTWILPETNEANNAVPSSRVSAGASL